MEGPFSPHPLINDEPAGLWTEGISMTCGCPFGSMWLPTLSFLVATNRDFEYRGYDEIYLELGGTDMEHLNEGGEEAA